MATNSMCDNTREDKDCELVFVENDAEHDEDYYDEYEAYRCEDFEGYGEVDSDRGRREKTNTEIADANSDDRRVEEQISSNEQEEDTEEREQSRYNSEGNSANADCAVDDELDVLPLQGSKSKVWSYFGFPAINGRYREEDKKERKEVLCRIVGCKKIVKYSGNTTNLLFHLQHMHPIAYDKVIKDQKQHAPPKMPRQLSITQAFEKGTPLAKTSHRWQKLTQSICYFIAKDMNPVATVNGVGFRRMIKEFEPCYVVPDRKTLRTNFIPKMYEHEKSHINHAIADVSSYALTTDIWSSCAMHSYMGVTIHFIDANFCLRSYLLDVKELLDNHTGDNIAEHLSEIMNDWHLSSVKLSGVTTDNGSNMLKAVDTLHWCHMPCFSHTLQLAVQVAMKLSAVSRAIAHCKRLINHFHHSVQSKLILRSKQKA